LRIAQREKAAELERLNPIDGRYCYSSDDDDGGYQKPKRTKRLDGEPANLLDDLKEGLPFDPAKFGRGGRGRRPGQASVYEDGDEFDEDERGNTPAAKGGDMDEEDEFFCAEYAKEKKAVARRQKSAARASRAEERKRNAPPPVHEIDGIPAYDFSSMEKTRGRQRRKPAGYESSVQIVDDDFEDDEGGLSHEASARTEVADEDYTETRLKPNLKDGDEIPDSIIDTSMYGRGSRRAGRPRASYAIPEEDEDGKPIRGVQTQQVSNTGAEEAALAGLEEEEEEAAAPAPAASASASASASAAGGDEGGTGGSDTGLSFREKVRLHELQQQGFSNAAGAETERAPLEVEPPGFECEL